MTLFIKKSFFISILLLFAFLICSWKFDKIDQPEIADPNSTFEVPITIALGSEAEGGIGYFGILLPIGWTVEDNITCSGVHSGTFVYSSAWSDTMQAFDGAPNDYHWRVFVRDSVDSLLDGTISFIPKIHTDNQTGLFFLDYMITDRFERGGRGRPAHSVVRSGYKPISVGLPMTVTVTNTNDSGDGSLRKALTYVSSKGEILFDLNYPATIVLDSTLEILHSLNITGPNSGELVISGNDTCRVFTINSDLTVNISNVIIANGNSDEGGGIIRHNSTLILTDVKITNNSAYDRGGGIYCIGDSGLTLTNVLINNNSARNGGGINIGSPLSLTDVTITNNLAINRGGGIFSFRNSDLSLFNVKITYNSANIGGGIDIGGEGADLKNVTISNNKACQSGGGVYIRHLSNSYMIFNSEEKCNIYMNTAGRGNDIYYFHWNDTISNIPIVLDTFTVKNPTCVHANPINKFNFDILNGKVNQSYMDQYISPDGDDNNSGTSPSEALKTTSLAIIKIVADSLNPRTIYLDDGLYSPSTTGEIFPLGLPGWVTLSGSSKKNTILDAEDGTGVITNRNGKMNSVENMTITRGSASSGGGIQFFGGSLYVKNVNICNNWGHSGGGIFCNDATLYLSKVSIFKNTSEDGAGGIVIYSSELNFDTEKRCNIYGNTSACGPPNDLFKLDDGKIISVVLDTFTVMDPTNYYAEPIEQFTFDILNSMPTGIDEKDLKLLHKFTLEQNYPNPFNPVTTINYQLPQASKVDLSIYNLFGQKVSTLVNKKQLVGTYTLEWDASSFSSGIYFCRLETDKGFVQARKLILLK